MRATDSTSQARPTRAGSTHPPREGVKDTVDSVVVAFILAFVFRAFLVEAFVIPTGSMAATLYGKHGTITCEDCGWEFAYGLADQSHQVVNDDNAIKSHHQVSCQNCGHKNTNLTINDRVGRRGNAEPGDRILVLKWPFDLGGDLLGPRRWDVVVFKDPSTGHPGFARINPVAAQDGTQNYIKRLLGLPDEVLEIVDGDVYTVPASELSADTMATLDALRHVKYLQYQDRAPSTPTRQQGQLAQRGVQDVLEELSRKLRICRKTPAAQQSLWTVVYDHDYPPQRFRPGESFWAPGRGCREYWDTSGRKILGHCLGRDGGYVRFSGKDGRRFTSDFCAYNVSPLSPRSMNPVSDLRLHLVLVPRDGGGHVRLALSKHATTFWAEIRMDGTVTLYRTSGSQPDDRTEPLCSAHLAPLVLDRPVEMSFQNVDYRVSLDINGSEILATTHQQYAPDLSRLRLLSLGPSGERSSKTPRIAAADLDFELWHVVLSHDIYYTSRDDSWRLPREDLRQPWRLPWGTTGKAIWLREGEYFMLGDNSSASKDSRLWDAPGDHLTVRGDSYQLGTVPEDQLIGRAFFVYWPAGHRSDLLPFLRNLGWIPNFGRMRWIR
ncbi:MAG: S26 family signal peptidase [Planctomycetota bacterium]|jgi:signal peptidase I